MLTIVVVQFLSVRSCREMSTRIITLSVIDKGAATGGTGGYIPPL